MRFYPKQFLGFIFGVAVFTFTLPAVAIEVPVNLKCLWSTYPDFKISTSTNRLVFADGRSLPYLNETPGDVPPDRKNLKSIHEMFITPYPKGFSLDPSGHKKYKTPTVEDDLIGSRYSPLFFELYGFNAKDIEKDLVQLTWVDGSHIVFNHRFGAAESLRLVIVDLRELIRHHPEYLNYLRQPIGGTFNWRHIAGEKNISMHAFAVAIDINIKYSNYWGWETGSDNVIHYRNRIPPDIAEIFENHGFIWGGKWYHYDTMHFEYRPELLLKPEICESEFLKYKS